MNLYFAYQRATYHPLGLHANWDDAAAYADGKLPGWHAIVEIGDLRALHARIGLLLGHRIPADKLYQHAEQYLDAVELKGATSVMATSARARLTTFIRQHAKEK